MLPKKVNLKSARLVSMALLLLAGCASSDPGSATKATNGSTPSVSRCSSEGEGDFTLYSSRKESLLRPIISDYEGVTGGKVALKEGKGAELVAALIEERKSPRADAFVGQDSGSLEELRDKEVFCSAAVDGARDLPDRFKASDGTWYGVSGRARVLMVNTNLVSASQVPKSIFDLTRPEWKGQLAMASSSEGAVAAWVMAMRKVVGEARTEELLRGLKANEVKVLSGHTEVRKSVASGETAIGLVNHYYYHIQKSETPDAPVDIVYTDQEPGQIGVLINVSGVGVVKGGRQQGAAQKFLSRLLTPEVQRLYAEVNYEYPLLPGVPVAAGVKPLGEIRQMEVNLEDLGDMSAALTLFDKVGLK